MKYLIVMLLVGCDTQMVPYKQPRPIRADNIECIDFEWHSMLKDRDGKVVPATCSIIWCEKRDFGGVPYVGGPASSNCERD